jgi:hypothetical protein
MMVGWCGLSRPRKTERDGNLSGTGQPRCSKDEAQYRSWKGENLMSTLITVDAAIQAAHRVGFTSPFGLTALRGELSGGKDDKLVVLGSLLAEVAAMANPHGSEVVVAGEYVLVVHPDGGIAVEKRLPEVDGEVVLALVEEEVAK